MLKHRRVKGFYFLFTLGFLLVFSSGFLAFLAWDGPGYQGSAAALEQPVTPPSLDSQSGKRPASKGSVGTKPTATLESPAIPTPPAPGEEIASQVVTPVADVKPAHQQQVAAPATPMEAKPVLTEKSDASSGHGVQSEKKLAGAKEEKNSIAKTQKKSRKPRRNPPAVVDETKVPPEWNWFATPLRFTMTDHKVEIVTDHSQDAQFTVPTEEKSEPLTPVADATTTESPASGTTSAEEPHETAEGVVATTVDDTREPASVVPFTVVDEHEAYAERLNNILSRLQERREKRAAEASARSLVLPSAKGEPNASDTVNDAGSMSRDGGDVSSATDPDVKSIPAASQEGLPPMPSDASDSGTDK